ncbi:methyltransferase family protein [Mesorhizobium calcicola]|uniref:Methyltransferase family protein n=1 Tax=Mesorhizobium calcicola TaxID=1300310 RepID=A0ABW4WBE2_9HYPH
MNLAIRTLKSAVVGLLVLGAIVFVPAGTLTYWQGWSFIVVFAISTNIIGVYLALRNPALLERRIKAGPAAETRPLQKVLIAVAFSAAILLVIFSVLDYRFGWSHVPAWVSVFGNVLVALGLMIDLRVFGENSYGASTIEKMEGQKVISTGPYALVRHPMYVGVLVLVVGAPLALGSYWGLLFLLLNVPILVLRVLDEEKMLQSDLDGYTDYMRAVRYRLIPGLW